ncbi:MAG: hypothetical protein AAF653_08055 [Chloroflexota bacterium]
MTAQEARSIRLTFSTGQYVLYAVVGFVIWLSGVVLVRVLGSRFFESDTILMILYGVSLVLGVAIQSITPLLVRQPMKDTLIPLVFVCGFALMCDGIAIGFTDIYSADSVMKVGVGGWLLWTFGTQLIISLIIVNRANNG